MRAVGLEPTTYQRRDTPMAVYAKREGSDTWHFCSNCSNYPKGAGVVRRAKDQAASCAMNARQNGRLVTVRRLTT